MELSIIIGVGIYAFNILDAYVSAHLKDFDVSDNLSLRFDLPRILFVDERKFYSTGLTVRF